MLNVGRYKGHMIKSLITRLSTSKNLANKTNCTTFEKTKFKKNCWISYAENISNACISFSLCTRVFSSLFAYAAKTDGVTFFFFFLSSIHWMEFWKWIWFSEKYLSSYHDHTVPKRNSIRWDYHSTQGFAREFVEWSRSFLRPFKFICFVGPTGWTGFNNVISLLEPKNITTSQMWSSWQI